MASSRDTQNGPDWKDVANSMGTFLEELEMEPTIRLELTWRKGRPSILMTARATALENNQVAPGLSVSVSADMLTTRAMGFEAALLLLLYDLDSKLAAALGLAEIETA